MKSLNEKGFTLLEVVVVVVLLSIIAAIAVPSVMKVIENAQKDACLINGLQLEREYERHLVLEGIDHTDTEFSKYLLEQSEYMCGDCEFNYIDGEVLCSKGSVDDDGKTGEVPYL